jgi:hypothetical protein
VNKVCIAVYVYRFGAIGAEGKHPFCVEIQTTLTTFGKLVGGGFGPPKISALEVWLKATLSMLQWFALKGPGELGYKGSFTVPTA